jgi:acyl-CoA synthetase (AMP-forming)/AMP-acid ligase II
MSTALAGGLKSLGLDEASVVGPLCRDHRGLIIAMAACGKLGARLVLMNTGFARVLTWVDEGTDLPDDVPTIDGIIAANGTEPLRAPTKIGGIVVPTSDTTGLPKGAPRAKVSPLATAELVDRVPFPRRGRHKQFIDSYMYSGDMGHFDENGLLFVDGRGKLLRRVLTEMDVDSRPDPVGSLLQALNRLRSRRELRRARIGSYAFTCATVAQRNRQASGSP